MRKRPWVYEQGAKNKRRGGDSDKALGVGCPVRRKGGICVSEQDAALPTKRADAAMAALLGR